MIRILAVLMGIIQFSFAFHAMKSGKGPMWITIILVFPVVGCVAYYFLEVFPGTREQRQVRKHIHDIAKALNPDGELVRLESVQNAIEQGKSGAAALMDRERPFTSAPWFWSDQFDVKLQMVGLSRGYDQVVTRGDLAKPAYSAFYYRAGRLLAVDSMNRVPDHMQSKRLLDHGVWPTPEQAADPQFDLTSLLKGAPAARPGGAATAGGA